MKKRSRAGLILYLVVVVALTAAVVGLLVYDIVVKKTVESDTILKAVLILVGLCISVFRVFGVGAKRLSPAVLKKHYGEHIGRAFENDPKGEKAFFRALSDYADGHYARALRCLEAPALGRGGRHEQYAVLFFKALCYDELGMLKEAIASYEAAFGTIKNSTAASNLGICYQRIGDFEAAIDAYKRAIEIDPQNAYPHNNLAQLYIREGEYEGALAEAELAIERNNNFYQALSAKAICHAMLGDTEAYQKALARAVACGADRGAVEYMVESMKGAEDEGQE